MINKRYVVGLDSNGVADILHEADWSEFNPVVPGIVEGREIWKNYQTPADLTGSEDPGLEPMHHEPPDGGAIFRVLTFHPTTSDQITEELALQAHSTMESDNVPSDDYLSKAKHPSMHKTDTLNYFYIASGEIWMLTEGRDVKVKQGDVIVQKGCMHGWNNDGTEPCTIIAVLIDAIPV